MIYWELLWGFLQVGCMAFGGAYAAIPFIRDIVLHYGWLDESAISYIIAISESTPGPIMINMATYIGQSQGGFWGAIIATTAVVIPAFLVTILIMSLLSSMLHNRWFRTCLRGLMPCIAGIISATGLFMMGNSICSRAKLPLWEQRCAVLAILLVSQFAYQKYNGSKLSPIALIVIAAVLGSIIL